MTLSSAQALLEKSETQSDARAYGVSLEQIMLADDSRMNRAMTTLRLADDCFMRCALDDRAEEAVAQDG